MKINEISYSPFQLKLSTPFHYYSAVIQERKGFLIKCVSENGNVGYGECSPLPGSSKETLNDANAELNKIIKELNGKNIPDNLSISDQFKIFDSDIPSVRFGIEQAIFNLMVQENKSYINDNFIFHKSLIDINAVIGLDDVEKVITSVKKKIYDGYKTIKLKIGREDPFDDFYIIVTLRNVLGYDFKLRLDANRKWSSDEAIEYLSRLQEFQIEYVEEPCEFVCSSLKTAEECPIAVGLDESIESLEKAYSLILDCETEILVVKPMILGGFFSLINLINEAKRMNKKIIISSSFESAVGKSGLVFLSSLIDHSYAHGLDTSDYFEQDICVDPYPVTDGKIRFDISCYPPKLEIF